MSLPGALDSRPRVWVDAVEVVECTDFRVNSPQPAGQKFGAAGMIGTFFGQAGCIIEFTFAVSSAKQQFETLVKKNQTPKTIVFTEGTSKFMARQCYWTDATYGGSYQSGEFSRTGSVIAGPLEQVA